MKYLLKKARKVILRDPATGEHKATLSQLKNITLAGNAEEVTAEGAEGVVLAAWDNKKTSTISGTSGLISMDYMALQVGDELKEIKDGHGPLFTEVITLENATKAETSYRAFGVAGGELAFIYPLDATGDPDRANKYVQAASASEKEFAYDPETKEITLPTGVFAIGDKVYVEYFPEFKSYLEIENSATKFSETCAVYVDGYFTDPCTKKDFPMQVYCPSGKVSAELNYQFGDQAAVQDFSINATVNSCEDEPILWKFYKYDLSEIKE